jgi:hypothetical protein
MRKQLLSYALILTLGALVKAQQTYSDQQAATPVEPMEHTPVYRVNVVSRTTQAVDYRYHSGGTSIDFRGTDLMPEASGHARVESRTGRIEIDTDFDHLRPSRSYGPQYLTYVLWAITPEGRPQNLGEIVPKDGNHLLLLQICSQCRHRIPQTISRHSDCKQKALKSITTPALVRTR